ncbi:helix-turn-helix domain-containing protein [Lactiplantibacillus mudanjiangensis]|uniref:XRE family transcriptional regulator [Lactobacillus plantarum] n=1 Tax=Lactiplantibacillus mudanjiangensis TaxID=1296538 RepID=A0A660DTQ8_9LACO|nr:helix-turn-helix domain-containing protein [Lactiplantibacillus mudanjiangensis]VDG20899.1 XRE family transcriptional regulator [Lactobacillus plantarum] [Lactiplantibacillus mudanjiangensis]VDG22630.1 XRE family transcriptional regulator [Lactobacillus plantarum] [Lactiplantibacillus mudanjiangensis]VDG26829.1 XRE family transcriptional regulator [Lactobacillus plantarum] [Lactiplantibacillus mudanjiangensis]VDG31971.1 XRE family transcriptional regulator [Lactobacillus plantarum] [Lactipla
MSIFAERLKAAMQQVPITSAQLAKQTGIGRSSISQWLSSKYVAKHDKVVVLAQALQVEPEWLIGAEVTEPVASEPTIDPELLAVWEQLDVIGRAKLLKKGHKLVAKASEPTKKPTKKSKKKKSKKASR